MTCNKLDLSMNDPQSERRMAASERSKGKSGLNRRPLLKG